MAHTLTHDSGIHHFAVSTDKQGHEPTLKCWCGKQHRLDFTWGMNRFVKGLNSFLVEHEDCVPLEEQRAVKTA